MAATNPIKHFIDKSELSTHTVSKLTGLSQMTVWRHYHGKARIDIDSQDAYEKIGIKIKEIREWNKELRGAHNGESKDNRAQGGNSGSNTV